MAASKVCVPEPGFTKRDLGDAPWPPHFAKPAGEPRRVPPSRARRKAS